MSSGTDLAVSMCCYRDRPLPGWLGAAEEYLRNGQHSHGQGDDCSFKISYFKLVQSELSCCGSADHC